ncbi:MAG: tyrosine-type recombinase/integrase, partial [Nitriliruptoraceae bacterium]
MKGTVWQRCTRCRRKVNGGKARASHKASGCDAKAATWAFKIDLGRDVDGTRRQALRGGFASEADAERELRTMLGKVEGGRYIEPTKRTLGNYLIEDWLTATAPPRVVESTYAKRKLHVNTYVVPRIGSVPLSDVSGARLDHLYAALIREGGRNGRPLSASSVRGVHATLNKAFADARRWRLIERNPCEEADPPRLERVAEDARAALHAWTAGQLSQFLESTRHSRYGTAFYVAATTGMRRSELCGLAWPDVDLDSARLRVAQKLVKGPDGYELRRATKTSAGARTLSIDGATVDVLRDHHKCQLELQPVFGEAYNSDHLVFPREDGSPPSPEGVSMAFRRAVTRSGLPRIRFHDLRHTHATILLQAPVISTRPVRKGGLTRMFAL